MLLTRLIVGFIGAPIIIAFIWYGGNAYAGLVLAATLVANVEALTILLPEPHMRPLKWLGIALGMFLAYTWQHLNLGNALFTVTPVLVFMTLTIAAILLRLPIEGANNATGKAFFAILYATIPLQLLARMRNSDLEFSLNEDLLRFWWVILAMGLPWMGDTGAYFAGRAFGRHPLESRISPKNTIEGAIGLATNPVFTTADFKAVPSSPPSGSSPSAPRWNPSATTSTPFTAS